MKEESGRKSLLFTGYAKLPAGITAGELYKVVGVVFEVDGETGKIIDADCTLVTGTGRRFFSKLAIGHGVGEKDVANLVRELQERYHGSAQRALITAVKAVHEKFQAHRERTEPLAEKKGT